MPDYTVEQEKIVLTVLKNPPHKYYEILEVTKQTLEGDLKKCYRKLAIKCHPDKNPHPRASEAFKIVNKAWEVLSDPSKKRIYDQTGSDPDLRASGFSLGASPFAGGGGQAFTEDDLFNMFFGGGGGGAQGFRFGGNGFQFHQFGGGSPFDQQRRQQQPRQNTRNPRQQEPLALDTLKQLLPMLLIFVVPMLLSLFTGGEDNLPKYSFTRLSKYPSKRQMPRTQKLYYVPEKLAKRSKDQLDNFDRKVEQNYIYELTEKCMREQRAKMELMEEGQGWFKRDDRKVKRAEKMRTPSCEEFLSFGLL